MSTTQERALIASIGLGFNDSSITPLAYSDRRLWRWPVYCLYAEYLDSSTIEYCIGKLDSFDRYDSLVVYATANLTDALDVWLIYA